MRRIDWLMVKLTSTSSSIESGRPACRSDSNRGSSMGLLYRGRREKAPAAALEGELLQALHRAGKARRESQRAQALGVVPAIGGELLEEVRLEPGRRNRRLAVE